MLFMLFVVVDRLWVINGGSLLFLSDKGFRIFFLTAVFMFKVGIFWVFYLLIFWSNWDICFINLLTVFFLKLSFFWAERVLSLGFSTGKLITTEFCDYLAGNTFNFPKLPWRFFWALLSSFLTSIFDRHLFSSSSFIIFCELCEHLGSFICTIF